MLGALFETHVVLDLLKQSQAMRHPPLAHHWRLHSGAEVDLILERDGMLVAIEAKCSSRVTRADTRGIPDGGDAGPQVAMPQRPA